MNRRLVIRPGGDVQYVYADELRPLAASLGSAETRRASHVEPDGDSWSVDLSPSGGPKVGGFETRQSAIDFELDWLDKNVIR